MTGYFVSCRLPDTSATQIHKVFELDHVQGPMIGKLEANAKLKSNETLESNEKLEENGKHESNANLESNAELESNEKLRLNNVQDLNFISATHTIWPKRRDSPFLACLQVKLMFAAVK
jgi:hypothetical protein